MSRQVRILITGFEPFPGAPHNPTQPLVTRLLRLRRPALGDVALSGHIFPVTYTAVDRELPQLLEKYRPQAVLMFGLAARTAHVRIETRARNAITLLWPDADHSKRSKGTISEGSDALMFGPHSARLLRAAASTGIDVRASRDAGSYLCNYLSWRAIEAARGGQLHLASFVHIPLLKRGRGIHPTGSNRRPAFEEVVDAGEAMLVEMISLTRSSIRGV